MSEKRKTIIRVNHRALPYFLVARSVAQNAALSYEALGLLVYLLSKPDDWEVQPKELAREHCGRDKAYRLLKELQQARHIERTTVKDDKGRIIRIEYIVHESPLPENPDTEKPDRENQHITEYREEQSTEKNSAPPELPDHAPMVARRVEAPIPQPDGGALAYTLIEAYCDAWNVIVERYRRNLHDTHRKASLQLAALGATPDEVKALVADKRATRNLQMDEYPLVFAARDYVAWKASQKAPVVVDELTAWRAAQKARKNERYDAALDMLLPAFKDEADRRRYIVDYLNLPYVPQAEEAAS